MVQRQEVDEGCLVAECISLACSRKMLENIEVGDLFHVYVHGPRSLALARMCASSHYK